MTQQASLTFTIGAEGEVRVRSDSEHLTLHYHGPSEHALYLALQTQEPGDSSPIVPYSQHLEGSTVFLPFPADYLFSFVNGKVLCRARKDLAWTEPFDTAAASGQAEESGLSFAISTAALHCPSGYNLCIYVKDVRSNNGWGWFLGCNDASVRAGFGDKVISSFYRIRTDSDQPQITTAGRLHSTGRERIYELFVRLFGNSNNRRKPNGTLAENGCGKFNDITDHAIAGIAEMGFTHIWLMGVIRHATTSAFDLPGFGADKTDLMKGLAGSPYAIKDYFDVAPDLATNPPERLAEFSALIKRIHNAGLHVLIDFVGNHVSRAYASQVRQDLDFGVHDDRSISFAPSNNFFYLQPSPTGGPPLQMPTYDRHTNRPLSPTCKVTNDCNGLFEGETTFGRVTGNNAVTWSPSLSDWYETVKLNYGYDFTGRTTPVRHFPHSRDAALAIPATWTTLDAVLAHWQALGVDGFRCDMAHMIPPEFWAWSISRARSRNPATFFMAEAYNDYFVVQTTAPEVLALGDRPLFYGLLHAGFNAVYGHDTYRAIKNLYDGVSWANDIDATLGNGFVSFNSVAYAENHDEIRLASQAGWGNIGMQVGIPVSTVLFTLGRGPILFYNGQEVGEPASDAEGFSGADGRTTIYDYWSMPELSKWVNGGECNKQLLSVQQRSLRETYARLLALSAEEVFRTGDFFGLNAFNIANPAYGRLPGETASGHWLYAFLRYSPSCAHGYLVMANLHRSQTFASISLSLPPEALRFLNCNDEAASVLTDRLLQNEAKASWQLQDHSVLIDKLPPLSASIFRITRTESERQRLHPATSS